MISIVPSSHQVVPVALEEVLRAERAVDPLLATGASRRADPRAIAPARRGDARPGSVSSTSAATPVDAIVDARPRAARQARVPVHRHPSSDRRALARDRISGVRASSTSTLSASSTIAKQRPRSTARLALRSLGRAAKQSREALRAPARRHAIAQVVEGDLLVGHVGDVARDRRARRCGAVGLGLDDDAGAEPETRVERSPSTRRRARPGSRWR